MLALSRHVSRAVARIDPLRYKQEPAYVTALFARLDGVVYRGRDLTLEFKSTIISDRAPGSAESVWGADFAIVASIRDEYNEVEKGVLGQAKRGSLDQLSRGDSSNFIRQVAKMNNATKAIVGLETPGGTVVMPTIRILEIPRMIGDIPLYSSVRHYDYVLKSHNNDEPAVFVGPAQPLAKYLGAELVRCLHGDTSEGFVKGLDNSDLSTLRIKARKIF